MWEHLLDKVSAPARARAWYITQTLRVHTARTCFAPRGRAASKRESKSVPMDKAFALHSEDCEFAQMLPHGLEPWTSRLLAERSNQLSYESRWLKQREHPWPLRDLVKHADAH